jgi:hypothetical protein
MSQTRIGEGVEQACVPRLRGSIAIHDAHIAILDPCLTAPAGRT